MDTSKKIWAVHLVGGHAENQRTLDAARRLADLLLHPPPNTPLADVPYRTRENAAEYARYLLTSDNGYNPLYVLRQIDRIPGIEEIMPFPPPRNWRGVVQVAAYLLCGYRVKLVNTSDDTAIDLSLPF